MGDFLLSIEKKLPVGWKFLMKKTDFIPLPQLKLSIEKNHLPGWRKLT